MLYTEQKLVIEDKEFLIMKHINKIVQNIDAVSKKQIKEDLLNLYDIISRY